MQKAIDVVAGNFNTMRTGRANPAILDRIQVRSSSTQHGLPAQAVAEQGLQQPGLWRSASCAPDPCT